MRKTSFQRTLEKLPPGDVTELEAVLSKIEQLGEPWHFVTPNIQLREHFLPALIMRRLLELMSRMKGAKKDQTESEYLAFCRAHTRQGGSVKIKHVASVLGCVKERGAFCTYLHRSYPLFRQIEDAEDFVRRLLAGEPLSQREDKIALGLYSIWCTWSPEKHEPFAFALTKHPDELRANLGLPPKPHERLLVFRYERDLPDGLTRPTVLDAELHPFFAPPPLTEKRFGMTMPWQEAHLPEVLRAGGTKLNRQPEALHAPILIVSTKQPELR